MAKITDPELEKAFILHELEEERLLWLGARISNHPDDIHETDRRMNALLSELHDVNRALGHVAVQADGTV